MLFLLSASHKAPGFAWLICLLFVVLGILQTDNVNAGDSRWNHSEWQTIQSLALDNLQPRQDNSNQYVNHPAAVTLGKKLFFDQRLSKHGQIACATCHRADKYFTDGRVIALGQKIGKRNTPSLHGVANNTWFFWDGRKDSLWSQALAPFENPTEHNFPRTQIIKLILADDKYKLSYEQVFGEINGIKPEHLPDDAQPSGNITQIKAWKGLSEMQRKAIDRVFANVGKAIAAFVTTIKPLSTRFDDYVAAYNSGEQDNTHLNEAELSGLRLFIDRKSQCINCHFGPLFTNQSFHNVGTGRAKTDSGRAAALDKLRFDRFNCMGDHSDLPAVQCDELKFMQRDRHSLWGSFKTPTLRNVSNTAPYFHDGRSQTLAEVIDHYTQSKADETHLQPLSFSQQEKEHLLAFLQALAAKE